MPYMVNIVIRTTNNPIARLTERSWEILVDGDRWFGPDTLAACIEAAPTMVSALDALASTCNVQPCYDPRDDY